MHSKKHNLTVKEKWISILKDMWLIIGHEFKTIFSDRGVVILFMVATIAYPLLYNTLYLNEAVVDVPVAIVDKANSQLSRELIRHIDAARDVKVVAKSTSMADAKQLFETNKVHGILYIPTEFDKKLADQKQAFISAYCDMSSFMYYRALMQATSYTVVQMGKDIQVERLNMKGIVGKSAFVAVDPIPYETNILFNQGMGFSSFLIPAILILIIHQTLFFGIGMLAGTSREENRFHELVSSKMHRGGTLRVVLGKSVSYFLIYVFFTFYILYIIPRVFNLPHIGSSIDLLKLMLPFLLATIFFSMTVSVFLPNRETGMILFLFFSLVLLFLSGVSWPQSNIRGFWSVFRWIFPAVHGVQGYIKINSMGSDIQQVSFAYVSLWIQTIIYMITTVLSYRWQIKKSTKKYRKTEILEIAK